MHFHTNSILQISYKLIVQFCLSLSVLLDMSFKYFILFNSFFFWGQFTSNQFILLLSLDMVHLLG